MLSHVHLFLSHHPGFERGMIFTFYTQNPLPPTDRQPPGFFGTKILRRSQVLALRSYERDAPAPKIQKFSFLNEDGRPGASKKFSVDKKLLASGVRSLTSPIIS
jgi:hypothetical protein